MTIPVTIIFITFFIINISLVLYLDYRNQKYIELNQDCVPKLFNDIITTEDHIKAARYSTTKIKAGYFITIFSFIQLLFWTLGGGINLIQSFVSTLGVNDLLTGIIFFLIFGFIGIILQLPESIYSTFVIEEKFGFNKTTPKTFIIDLLKEILVSLVIGIPLLAIVLFLMMNLGSFWWLYAWGTLTIFKIILMFIYPIWIAPIFNKFTPLESGDIKTKVEELLKATNFISKGLFVMDASRRSKHGNAYFVGFGKNKRIVFFDNLLESLTSNEIVAILAHELGHFKKKHIFKMMITSSLLSLLGLYILSILYKTPSFYNGHGVNMVESWLGLALFMMVTPIYLFLIKPIFSYISRVHEFEADDFARDYSDPNNLISALKKLHKDNASTLTPDPIYSKFYYSHPPAIERVQNLSRKK